MFEHGSTHIDAPAHYAQGRAHLHELSPEQLIGPGVMIDITVKAKQEPDYLVTIQDITVSWMYFAYTVVSIMFVPLHTTPASVGPKCAKFNYVCVKRKGLAPKLSILISRKPKKERNEDKH